MHAADQFAQLDQGFAGEGVRVPDLLRRGAPGRQIEHGQPESHVERHEALLGAVVQVAFDAPPFRVERADEAGT